MQKLLSLLIVLISGILYFLLETPQTPTESEDAVKKNEKYYQTRMCDALGGEVEHILFDKTRVDCLTREHAIEVDFAKKWAEGIGQALYYAEVTGKKPAVGLIVGEGDQKYLKRLEKVAQTYRIKVIVIPK
ncbi:MAG: hypothetical protein PHI89_02930 [Thiovulaceae bacterium]|nr:hypothetical protein [Sulfurimonadaceae bacterium]MDD3817019.1 hypothetical protein [Sulfurimonadaceae bacterium]